MFGAYNFHFLKIFNTNYFTYRNINEVKAIPTLAKNLNIFYIARVSSPYTNVLGRDSDKVLMFIGPCIVFIVE